MAGTKSARVATLRFARPLPKSNDIPSVMSAALSDLRAVFPAARYGEISQFYIRTGISALSNQDRRYLQSQPRWTSGLPTGSAAADDVGCPPPNDGVIDAILRAISECGGKAPKISCNCANNPTGACAKYDTDSKTIELCLNNRACPGSASWKELLAHELMHHLQNSCAPSIEPGNFCERNIAAEFQAYLCQSGPGACSGVLDCCAYQAMSSDYKCGGYLNSFRRCLKMVENDPDKYFNMRACCPGGSNAGLLPECADNFSGVGIGSERRPGPDGICDAYQQCRKDKDKDRDGICDIFQQPCGGGCTNDNIGQCFIAPRYAPGIERTVQCADSINKSCDGTPGNRKLGCADQSEPLVCCNGGGCPPNATCWRPASECAYPAWCSPPPEWD